MNPKKLGGRLPVIIILAVVILAAIGIYRRHEGGKSTLADTYRRPRGDTLAVAIEMGHLTYNFRNDTAAGFDYEILRDIGRRHGVDMVFHPVGQLAEAFERLNEGDYDLLVASMPSTRTLKSYFPVTDPVYIDRQVLVQYADSTSDAYVASAEQLRGDTVWIVEGSPFRTRILNMSSELGDSIHLATIPGQSAENLAMLTAKGRHTPRRRLRSRRPTHRRRLSRPIHIHPRIPQPLSVLGRSPRRQRPPQLPQHLARRLQNHPRLHRPHPKIPPITRW